MKELQEMTYPELKAETIRVAIELKAGKNIARNRDRHQAIKAEVLARAARVIAEGRDTPELLVKVEKLAMGR